MATVSTADFKNGMYLNLDEGLMQISEFQHVKPGKGGAFVRTKLKNVRTGRTLEKTFNSGVKVEQVSVDKRDYQYLYREANNFVFMDLETYDQMSLDINQVGDAAKYLKESDNAMIPMFGTEALGVELPASVELTIVETEPGIQGDRVSGASKPATLETGLVIQVPLFINQDERVKVDTRTGEYITRV